MLQVNHISTFAAAPTGASKPDSIVLADGSLIVEYGNAVASDGSGGPSTIIQYDKAGNIVHTYTIAGSVDGLKYNPYTGQIWALQNQDGNSTVADRSRDPQGDGPPEYANPSATSGYDDAVFEGNKVFLSYTNPAASRRATLVELRTATGRAAFC